jgi:SSS family solute:Na+ symporter
VVPGVIAYALAQSGQLQLDRPDAALPMLVATLLPEGIRGLVVAGLLAALMSSLSSVFNSCSTLITWDVYRKLRPQAPERTLVRVGQVSTLVLVGFGLLWIPLMELISGQLYQYIQSVQAYISPPIAAVFLVGIASRRVNAHGAIAALVTGAVLGFARLAMELNKASLDGWMLAYAQVNFLHFAAMLFFACAVVLVVVSLLTAPPPRERIEGLTLGGTVDGRVPRNAWWRVDVVASMVLVLAVFATWFWFR